MRATHVHVDKKREREEPKQKAATPLTKFELSEADRIHHLLQVCRISGKAYNLHTDGIYRKIYEGAKKPVYLCLDFPDTTPAHSVKEFRFTDGVKTETFRASVWYTMGVPGSSLYLTVEFNQMHDSDCCLSLLDVYRGLSSKKAKLTPPDSVRVMQQAVNELKTEMEPRVRATLTAKWESIIARDLLQVAQADLDRKKAEVESRLKDIQVAQALNLFPPNQQEITNILDQDN